MWKKEHPSISPYGILGEMGDEVLSRFGWALIVLMIIAYATYLFFGSVHSAEAEAQNKRIEVFDLIATSTDTHRLSGMLLVPTGCHSLSWETTRVDEKQYHVAFSTFGDVHGCTEEVQARAFRLFINEPPIGWFITASLNDAPLDFRIIRTNYAGAVQ